MPYDPRALRMTVQPLSAHSPLELWRRYYRALRRLYGHSPLAAAWAALRLTLRDWPPPLWLIGLALLAAFALGAYALPALAGLVVWVVKR